MYKLSFKKRIWIVKQHLKGNSTSRTAMSQNISRMTISNLVKTYNEQVWDSLKDHKTGRPETSLNTNSEVIIIDLRRRYKCGVCRIENILRNKGFSISHRQIEKVLNKYGLVRPNIKTQKPRKWVRYELLNPNDIWHTDWSYDPFSGKNLSVYLDDRTRVITSYGIFSRSTAENSIALLKEAIAAFGKPKAIMTDHGSQYYTNRCDNQHQNTAFRNVLNHLGIKHVLACVNRPQTNEKVERFFETYKTEFLQETFFSVADYMKYYNNERLHISLGNKTPRQLWDELKV
ncbi:MAG: DDE-type integrase/transposase/recombinase [Candidatus Woesearchaeota archaeon]